MRLPGPSRSGVLTLVKKSGVVVRVLVTKRLVEVVVRQVGREQNIFMWILIYYRYNELTVN